MRRCISKLSFDVEIICVADDTQRFTDVLYFVIKEGVDKEVQLKARGVGSTIFCKDLRFITFGTLYTFREQVIETFIENKGRRRQTLRWTKKSFGKMDNVSNKKDALKAIGGTEDK